MMALNSDPGPNCFDSPQLFDAHVFNQTSNDYLDDSVVEHMESFNPEIKCDPEIPDGTFVDEYAVKGDSEQGLLGATYSLDGTLSNQDGALIEDPLNQALLNGGFEGSFTPIPSVSQFPQHWEGVDNELYHGPLAQSQQGDYVVAPSPQQYASSIANTTFQARPRPLKRSSNLRNEYDPNADFKTLMAEHHAQPAYTSSPSRYMLRPVDAVSTPRHAPQTYQASDPKPSLHHLLGYQTFNRMTHSPPPAYHNPQDTLQQSLDFSSYGGLPAQPAIHHTNTTPRLRELAMAPPSTPPNMYLPYSGMISGDLSFSDSSAEKARHERSSRSRKPHRKFRIRANTTSSESNDVDGVSYSESDKQYLEEMVLAMEDMSQAEDNAGMKGTWSKMLTNKGDMIRPKCIEMLSLLKRADKEQLGDKKSTTVYHDLDYRIGEFCDAVRTQKTIAKHLMESPYSHTVANDPTYAASRVRNNRRVNGQKRTAINLGRKAMGLKKGQGKGHRLQRLNENAVGSMQGVVERTVEDGEGYSEDSTDDDISGADDFSNSPVIKSEPSSVRRSARRSAQKNYVVDLEDSPIPKKKRRSSQSKNRNMDDGQMIGHLQSFLSENPEDDASRYYGSPGFHAAGQTHEMNTPSSSPNYLARNSVSLGHHLQPGNVFQNSHVYGSHPYGPTAPLQQPLHLNHNTGYHPHSMLPSGPMGQHYTDYPVERDQRVSGLSAGDSPPTDVNLGNDDRPPHEPET